MSTPKAVLIVIGAVLAIVAVGYIAGWFADAADVAKEEFGPRAALQKYEWFKDAAATLDKRRADITNYQGRLDRLSADYPKGRATWAREDREQANVWESEVAGIKAAYNSLAAEYNAEMAKFNWRFANAGQLPAGATTPLPREFKPYIEEGGE